MPVTAPTARAVHRIEVWSAPGQRDPRGRAVESDAAALGYPVRSCRTAKVYLIEGSLSDADVEVLRARLLTDAVSEQSVRGASPAANAACVVEVHPLPGVMDPAAQSVRDAVRALTGEDVEVSTGWRYDIEGVSQSEAETLAKRLLANTVVHGVHLKAFKPDHLPRGTPAAFKVRHITLRSLDDAALEKLSRDAHLFLSLEEMRAIRDEYRRLEREPTDIELETLAQTWSEHCVHKTLKSTIQYRPADPRGADPIKWQGRPGHSVNPDGSITIRNLLKSTVAAATHELIGEGLDWTLSVFTDNSGVIAFDENHAVCIKVETHNHPSAIEPYGGAATGAGGCIRDVIGTGLGAKPVANTDVFCVAPPDLPRVPPGCIHPARTLREIVRGVRDYGNQMGIPTVNGAVWFDERHVGNPLVFCGCIGVMERRFVKGAAREGDLIVAVGGRTGRDGIHGATFSSAELTDTHADEFAHAVQIGNAIEEKRLLDAILRARDAKGGPLYHAITDCGAGGFSSAVGEMGSSLGAEVHLDRAPLKYEGLTYTEIWISEAQERMVLAVPEASLDALQRICREEGVEIAVLGRFGTPGHELILHFHAHEVGRLPMHFLHDGIPTPVREAVWTGARSEGARPRRAAQPSISDALLTLLSHPNIASKHWLIRQYDHEVQGNTVVKPLVGPRGIGPADAAVVEPVPGTGQGLAVACGLATGLGDAREGGDPYLMALAAIDECVRNLVCAGADPSKIAILDNFCWPSCKKPENLASLVRAAEGCYDGAKAYRTPFVSGKDSLNNQFTTEDGQTIEIPPTLLITGLGIVPQLSRAVTSDAKRPGRTIALLRGVDPTPMLGSHYARLFGVPDEHDGSGQGIREWPRPDLKCGPAAAAVVHQLIRDGLVYSAHDVSDGGVLVAVAEMLIGGSTTQSPLGARLVFQSGLPDIADLFSEAPSAYLLEIAGDDATLDRVARAVQTHKGLALAFIGELTDSGELSVLTASGASAAWRVETLRSAWRAPLDW